jgi:hypothetical protein
MPGRASCSTSPVFAEIEEAVAQFPELSRMEWIATDEVDADLADVWHPPAIDPEACLPSIHFGFHTPSQGRDDDARQPDHICATTCACSTTATSRRSVCCMPYFHDYGLVAGDVPALQRIPHI